MRQPLAAASVTAWAVPVALFPPGTGVPLSPVKEHVATRLATENTPFLSLSLTAGRGSGPCSGIFLKGEVAGTRGPGAAPRSPRWGPRRARPLLQGTATPVL